MPAHKRETLRVIEDDRGSHDRGEDSTLLASEDPVDVLGVPVPEFDGLAYELDRQRPDPSQP